MGMKYLNKIKHLAKISISKFGYILSKKKKKIWTKEPLEIFYKLRSKNVIFDLVDILEVRLEDCISHNGMSFSKSGYHPFTHLLKEYKKNTEIEYNNSVLNKYYSIHRPKYAFEPLIGNNKKWEGVLPHFAYIFPWEEIDYKIKIQNILSDQNIENKVTKNNVDIKHGISHHGPVTKIKGNIELERLINIYKSIYSKGYNRHDGYDGDIMGSLLKRNNEYKFIVEIGFHRIAALSILGYEYIPVRLLTPIIIEKEHAKIWPQVNNGIWDFEDSKKYFDLLFDFKSTEWAKNNGIL